MDDVIRVCKDAVDDGIIMELNFEKWPQVFVVIHSLELKLESPRKMVKAMHRTHTSNLQRLKQR